MTSLQPAREPRQFSSSFLWRDLNFICWGLLLLGFIVPFTVIVLGSHRPPDGDFAGFYSLGRIAITHPLKDIYNYDLLRQICMEVHPRLGGYGPLPYPPQVALLFAPFALLPYWLAYSLWLLISLVLYGVGVKLVVDHFLPLESAQRSLLFCLAFSYCPFLVDDALSGQISAIGFLALSYILCEKDQIHPGRTGLALVGCSYKPTLLILIVPMLLVTRRFRMLLSFAVGSVLLAMIPAAIGGWRIWPEFANYIGSYAKVANGAQASAIRLLVKYVDLSSFTALVPGGRSWPWVATVSLLSIVAASALLRFWWIAPSRDETFNCLVWATTFTWTLLLNVYVPIYDSILIVSSLFVTIAVTKRMSATWLYRWTVFIGFLILASSWVTVRLADIEKIQVLTLLIAALGTLQLLTLGKLSREQHQPA